MPHTQLLFFGPPRIVRGDTIGRGEEIPLRMRKAQALLAYLAVSGQPHSRDALATLLWPENNQRDARGHLRRELARVRGLLGKEHFTVDNETIALNLNTNLPSNPNPDVSNSPSSIPSNSLYTDVAHFKQLVAQSAQCPHDSAKSCADCLSILNDAAAVYTDDFLAGFTLSDSPEFDDWQFFEREGLRQTLAEVLVRLVQGESSLGAYDQAIPHARRQVALDPLHEPAQRQLMGSYALAGQQAAALRQYESCVRVLDEELGTPPDEETAALYDLILAGELRPESLPSITAHAAAHTTAHATAPSLPVLSHAPKPFQVTAPPPHFVGRLDEIERVRRLLNEAGTPIVALVGMGGLGKTTLANQIAHLVQADFPDGVLWANPAISSVMDILDNWGRAYGYDFSGLADVESRAAAVRGVLAEKSALLVLDNVTHAAQIKPLFASGTHSPVLLTTRDLDVAHALNAQVISLGELSAESGRALLVNILGAERVSAEEEAAREICQQLHFLPLAVEIAAQRLKSRARMKLTQMAERLKNEQQRLGLEISDRAVRTSFEVSWEALDEELQSIFPLLAVFEGRPFTPEALAYIADMDQFDVEDALFGLSALSLVKEDEEAYYRQHPLLADFAKEKLVALPYHQHEVLVNMAGEKLVEQDVAFGRLVNYYLEFVEVNQRNYDDLEPEWGNIQAAIQIAYEHEQWREVISFTMLLEKTWMTRARYGDARQAYGWAQEAAIQLADESLQCMNLLRWGEVCVEQSAYDEANQHLRDALTYYCHREEGKGIADVQFQLARIAIEQNKTEDAHRLLSESLSIRKELGDDVGIASIYHRQARMHHAIGNFDEAEQLAQAALSIQDAHQDRRKMIPVLRLLAQISARKQDYELAHSHCERARSLSEEFQDEGELAMIYYTLTIIYRRQNDLKIASLHAEKAVYLLHLLGLRRLEGMALSQRSRIYVDIEEYQLALDTNLESIQIFQSVQDDLGQAYSLLRLGDIYHHLEQPVQTMDAWRQVYETGKNLGNQWLLDQLQKRLLASHEVSMNLESIVNSI